MGGNQMHSVPAAQLAYKLALFSLTAASLLISPSSFAQEAEEQGVWSKTKATLTNIAEEGRWDLYLSGYAYHGRNTYTEERIQKLNEKAWGAGVGKTVRNEKGNDESLYFMEIRDSHMHPQWMAGYSYQWIHPITTGSSLEVGAGVTALLMRRTDWFGGVPFPVILPVASIGTQGAKLMATFVPRLSTPKGKGDVILLFAKFEFD